ncbi:MAG: hypothetical protein SCK57_10820 [Bacillota bacterium]|nr:hypothetical protein [Bacillota bacterium]MDW7678143.1 hypothetical protein [Bacillota bacterium]
MNSIEESKSDGETVIIYSDIDSTLDYVNGERRTMDAALVEWDPGMRRVTVTYQAQQP